jgi:choline dehydrogenase-like flavoprotein
MNPEGKAYDAIVVGSGPGGATVARELSKKGKKVLIVEWGDNDPVKGTAAQAFPQIFMPGKSLMITGQFLGMVRGITTGGSSIFYCATAFDPPVAMLKSYGVDISAEVEEVRAELPTDPLCDDLMSPAGARFMESARDLGYNARKLNKFIYQDKCKKDCDRCSYGCPEGAKWTARNFVKEAVANGAEMINRARADKVIVENGRATGLQYRRGGKRSRAYAPRVIVAAGGIGSPLILRNSGIGGVGRDFFFDPLCFVYGTVKDGGGAKGIQMCSGIHFADEGIVMTDFNMTRLLKVLFDLEVFRLGQVFNYANVVPIMIKVRDGLGGHITDAGWVWKPLQASDKRKLRTGRRHAKRILKNMGATNIYGSWLLAAHPGGSVKIGEHLDTQLQTKIENLYVCDCSVIPEELGLPPTFTILSLAKRLARHLLDAKESGPAAAASATQTI